jgi:hypothetical protein
MTTHCPNILLYNNSFIHSLAVCPSRVLMTRSETGIGEVAYLRKMKESEERESPGDQETARVKRWRRLAS